MARFISNELFHFVGRKKPEDHEKNFDILKDILRNGCVSHPPHNNGWGTTSTKVDLSKGMSTEELVVPTVTCYCDIPFESLGLHLSKYGQFGLSFDKDLLIRLGARPVIYVPLRSDDLLTRTGKSLLRDIDAIYRGFISQIYDPMNLATPRSRSVGVQPNSPPDAVEALNSMLTMDFLAFIKPYDSELPEIHVDYYYSEREWRKYGNLKFKASDLRKIVVAERYVKGLTSDMPQYQEIIHAAPI